MSLCESECNYIDYDYDTKNSKCECEIKKEMSIFNIKIDTQRLYDKFTGSTSSNIDIIKCYYLLLKKENLIYNIGFYIIFLFCIGINFYFQGVWVISPKNKYYNLNHKKNKQKNGCNFIKNNKYKKYK